MSWESQLRLRHIRTFLEIARAESVSVAAEQLNITQPAVSRSLKELEQMLGVALFDRVGRGLRLNEEGRIFQSHASASMVELMRGRDRLSASGDHESTLSIGVLPTAATDLLPRAVMQFRQEMPNVRLHVMTGPNWLLFNQLRDGSVDMVVGRMPETLASGISFQQLYIEDVVLVARPGHPIFKSKQPESQVAEFDLILPPKGAVIRQTVSRYLLSIGLSEKQSAIETVALPVGRKLLCLSDALWFISRGVVGDEIDNQILSTVALSSPLLSGPVGISIARSAPIRTDRSVFAECLHRVAQESMV